jgi:HAD superfamily hydrolase (TIGR01509 family)
MAPRALAFDMDGVLIHSTESHRQAFAEVFEELGVQEFEYSAYAGRRTADVIADVLRSNGRVISPETIAGAARKKSQSARRKLIERKPIDPECGAVLAAMAASYPLGLATSGSAESVDLFLKLTGSRSLFRSILSGKDVAAAKPDPEIYLRSARELGVDPPECLVIEDSQAGIQAARAANAIAWGIAGTMSSQDLLRAGADSVLPNLGAITNRLKRGRIDASRWTAVVPAAGRGSRLGFHRPKILFPVAGRLILDWLLDFLVPNCASLVFVVSPDGVDEVIGELERRIPGRFETVVQQHPTGMADAVALGLTAVRTQHVAIVWGDQVGLCADSVETCLALHQGPLDPVATCPTVIRTSPYIHFDRDDRGRLTGVLQAREGDTMPETGESDAGFFCFRADALRQLLPSARADGVLLGRRTAEFNFLPIIPRAAHVNGGAHVLTPRHVRVGETVGINSAADVATSEQFLETAKSHSGRFDGCQV